MRTPQLAAALPSARVATAPRTPDGRPDFTGVWVNAWFVHGRVLPLPVSPPGEPPAATFGDVFANFAGPLPLQQGAAADGREMTRGARG